ncbi:MAG: helix-turn-helix domain-containing protein [Bacteroidales bacterium]|nr:helix-turn-helix domain-containing protein [Bacteroidales bacterium]
MDSNKIVGERIKSLRESKSMSIEELAQKAELSVEQIKRIEEDIDLPSLSPLIKISHALEVRLGTFFDDQSVVGPVICHQNQYEDTVMFSNNSTSSRKNMEYHSLSRSKTDRHMEPFIIDVNPIEKEDFVLSTHEGEEFIYILNGTMELVYGKNKYLLNPGDSVYYDSIIPHHIHGYQGQKAKILAVIYTPV